jgi:hypothetical protein
MNHQKHSYLYHNLTENKSNLYPCVTTATNFQFHAWNCLFDGHADTHEFRISQPPKCFGRLLQNHSPIYSIDAPVLGQKRRMIAYTFQPRVVDNIHRDKLRAEWQNIQISAKWFVVIDNFCQWFSFFPPCLHFKYWYTVSCCCRSWNSKTCTMCIICTLFIKSSPT